MAESAGAYVPGPEEQQEFDRRLEAARVAEERVVPRLKDGTEIAWFPQAGSQTTFLQCPLFECLFHGTRGPGKTDGLLFAFAQHVGKGLGAAWRGIIFRQSYPQLADVQAKSEKWFRLIFPGAKFNRAKMMWEWPTGEVLLLRHMNRPDDYWNYHGHEYPFIGFEELTNWPTAECYTSMFACCRSSTPGVPRMIRATTNPYGPGHNWVKGRFRLTGQWWKTVIITDAKDAEGRAEPPRCSVHGHISENKILLAADPDYQRTIVASASNPAMAEAWLSGSWDIVSGGMFDDAWNPAHNIVPPFDVPGSWTINRSFDWGSAAPFSVGWWARSDGSDVRMPGLGWMATVRGDLFRVREWYGWNGQANQGNRMLATDVASGIVERELLWGIHGRVRPGPADGAIFSSENGNSVAVDMGKPIRINGREYKGVTWTRADKRPGSRKAGWEQVRIMMKGAHPVEVGARERPGLFVVGDHCEHFLRTVPVLPRCKKDPEDADTDAEDHIADEVRYEIRGALPAAIGGRTTGLY